jgi:hypothetical protein
MRTAIEDGSRMIGNPEHVNFLRSTNPSPHDEFLVPVAV